MKEHLIFIDSDSASGKTKIIKILSKFDGSRLGEIKWKPTWRCYCFFPVNDYETY